MLTFKFFALTTVLSVACLNQSRAQSEDPLYRPTSFKVSKDRRDRDIWLLKWREEIAILERLAITSPKRQTAIKRRIGQLKNNTKKLSMVKEVDDYRFNFGVLSLANTEALNAARLLESLGGEVSVNPTYATPAIRNELAGGKDVVALSIDENEWIGTSEEIDRIHKVIPIVGLSIKAHKNPLRLLKQFAGQRTAKAIRSLNIQSCAMLPELLSQIRQFQSTTILGISCNNLKTGDYADLKHLSELKILFLYGKEPVPAKLIDSLTKDFGLRFVLQVNPSTGEAFEVGDHK